MSPSNQMTERRCAFARCDATGPTDRRHGLYGHCVTCGATVHDWRRLLGVGARIAACIADARAVQLTYPGACGGCGGSELVISVA
jgi:hypothetical protein